jgi:hypothetical protein
MHSMLRRLVRPCWLARRLNIVWAASGAARSAPAQTGRLPWLASSIAIAI